MLSGLSMMHHRSRLIATAARPGLLALMALSFSQPDPSTQDHTPPLRNHKAGRGLVFRSRSALIPFALVL